ncbi:MAG: PKD domain-containing protein [Bacteroidetes bacterium]|jgi:PKD repeat protein|nr:PKD domain-containing protein [Bacteroidota bacterium]MBT4400663.1 PKD domain-containing protein [Bacteroidota bacterium]MBT4410952.1 PKD domain-containing protein [Bacteroidota bacterium]MBT5426600.1 PKD domain-containing protein [Bacteroidota bacterium]MBT7092781.1 PKD domain-containing protein [Bacteroidota bacterium]
MKKIASFLISLTVIGFMVLSFSSCKKVDPPTVTIFASVDGYVVAFTATATDTDNYSWTFGDGEVGSDQNPVHTYAQSGSYTATLTVTGEGGVAEVSTTVTIAASPLEMLTGGPAAANGKTWVFSPAGGEGDGIYKADVDFTFEDPLPAGILGLIGLPTEYEDEFTFHNDLSYSHDVKNDSVVTDIIFAMINQIPFRPSAEDVIVLCPFIPSAATFTFTEGTDLTLETTSDSDNENIWETTWSGVTVLEIEGGAEFLGVMDFTRKYIVFNISVDALQLGIFVSATEGSKMNYPSHLLRMTFIPK